MLAMMSGMAGDPFDLSGAWKGIFHYPRVLPPEQFDAQIQDFGGALTGEISERPKSGRLAGEILHSVLTGNRQGTAVNFTKYYDHLRRAHYLVHYDGQLRADGEEISGDWSIPGIWSGTFLMIRNQPQKVSESRKSAETV